MRTSRSRLLMIRVGLFLMVLGLGLGAMGCHRKRIQNQSNSIELQRAFDSIRAHNGVPAIAGFTVTSSGVIEMAATGVRVAGYPEEVTIHDRWHLGSITKPITTTLAALLVQRGVISWNTRVKDVYPDLANSMRAEYSEVTLEDLLRHESGLARNVPGDWLQTWDTHTPIMQQRRNCVALFLCSAPEVRRGTPLYSNSGFILAGSMLEERTGKPWEDLIQRELFQPLQMQDCGFGPPGTASAHDHPWGHVKVTNSFGDRWHAYGPTTPGADNPPTFGPCGRIHATLEDIARFAAFELACAKGSNTLLSAESYIKIHTPDKAGAAMGWPIFSRTWANGPLYAHAGSNNRWFAELQIAPGRDVAFFAVVNAAGENAEHGVADALNLLRERFEAKRKNAKR